MGVMFLKRIGLGSIDVVVKSFKKPHIINRVVYSFFPAIKSRAFLYLLYGNSTTWL